MNLRFVEAFVWVARLESITRAAERLNLTQSAVSARVAALENDFGTPFIDRSARGFRLTWAGERFLMYADRLMAVQQQMRNELSSPEQEAFVLRLGAIETVLHSWLVRLVHQLKVENPRIGLEITVEMTPVLNDLLRRGALDLIFTAAPAAGEGLRSRSLKPMDVVFVGPAAMMGRGVLSAQEVCAHDLLTFQRGSHPHVALEEALRRHGRGDKRPHCFSSIAALAQLVEGGFGLATLPRAAAEPLSRRYGITLLETEMALAPLPMHAAFRDMGESPGLSRALDKALELALHAAADGVDEAVG